MAELPTVAGRCFHKGRVSYSDVWYNGVLNCWMNLFNFFELSYLTLSLAMKDHFQVKPPQNHHIIVVLCNILILSPQSPTLVISWYLHMWKPVIFHQVAIPCGKKNNSPMAPERPCRFLRSHVPRDLCGADCRFQVQKKRMWEHDTCRPPLTVAKLVNIIPTWKCQWDSKTGPTMITKSISSSNYYGLWYLQLWLMGWTYNKLSGSPHCLDFIVQVVQSIVRFCSILCLGKIEFWKLWETLNRH